MPTALQSSFTQEELEPLSAHFRLTSESSVDKNHSIAPVRLLDEQECTGYIDRVSGLFGATERSVGGSLFAKRYSYLTVTPVLYAMTMYGKGLDAALENCSVESMLRDDGVWLPKLRLTDWSVSEASENGRREWRDNILRSLFAGNIARLWRSLSKANRISSATLWENTAVNVFWLYEKGINVTADPKRQARIREDYDYLLSAPGDLFGEKSNPLIKFDSPKVKLPAYEQPLRIRKTCCLYYRTDGERSYCSICPKEKQN
ncbi:IucA/IucC family C-terminal-domain containing protein [Paenibacillus harenae]|uniref:IucA/IucC family C-terminal-domain containing protein n=1 Tax=Paenibacillus harenae TaxID=306543 RepID=UPI00278D6D37|nr:IucA/IucC family C-terminal-domain containing protein [Paenibacillus harenae]MDQ0062132.1 ferric iron reductase protein FhuF [Paenibacillus harenae]